jgi:hypothetical protein
LTKSAPAALFEDDVEVASTTRTIADITPEMIAFEIKYINISIAKALKKRISQVSLKKARLAWETCSRSLEKKEEYTVQLYVHALNLTDEANIEFAIARLERGLLE